MSPDGPAPAAPMPRPPAVAGLFYDDEPEQLGRFVDELLLLAGEKAGAAAGVLPKLASVPSLAGILVPHAGLVYSGLVAASGWRLLAPPAGEPVSPADGPHSPVVDPPAPAGGPAPTVVLLGTNHGAGWLTGVGAWDGGPWRTPLGDVAVDDDLVRAVLALGGPFEADRECHLGEHSLEVQLPFLRRVAPGARIVPLAVGTGTGTRAIEAGTRLGRLLARRRAAGDGVVLAISTDMAHYPRAEIAERVTAALLPHVIARDPAALAEAEARVRRSEPRTSCGMCGIEPAVLGLAALRALGAGEGVPLAAATSADAGGDAGRTVGYLAVAYPAS